MRIIISVAVAVLIQGCSPVDFESRKVAISSFDIPVPITAPETFELSSTGVAEQPDQTGEIFLSGSIGGTPAMDIVTLQGSQDTLATGFHSILSTFQ